MSELEGGKEKDEKKNEIRYEKIDTIEIITNLKERKGDDDDKKDNIKIIGPLHWVFHFEKKYEMKKKLFFEKNNLNLNKKTVLISLKSPTRTKINEIMRFLNHLLKENLLKDVQFIINPHPINFSENTRRYCILSVLLPHRPVKPKVSKSKSSIPL